MNPEITSVNETPNAKPKSLNKMQSSFKTWMQSKGLWRGETTLIGGAVFFAIFGAALQKSNQVSFENKIKEQYSISTVLVASGRIPQGTILSRQHFSTQDVLSGNRTDNMLSQNDMPKLIGKQLEVSVVKGDPMLLSFVGSSLSEGGVASKIPSGKRLFSLKIDDPVAQNGFIRPGDFVDIITTMDLPGRGSTTFTLLSRVQLSAVGKSFDSGSQLETAQVSFLVSPQEMEIMKHAQAHGVFSLSLRNPNDKEVTAGGKGVTLKDVFLKDGFYEKSEIQVEINNGGGNSGHKGKSK
jgi:pilus assembly protein CpaB